MADNHLTETRESLIAEIERRVEEKILEKSNAALLIKLIRKADSLSEAIKIAQLGTTYKKTGFHYDKRLEPIHGNTIKYFKKNEELSFSDGKGGTPHKLIIGDNFDALQNLLIQYRGKVDVIYIDPPYGKDSMGEFAKTNYDNALTRDNLLSMLHPRLVLAKQLLSKEGVIFCSIDDRNQAYVKCLFDDVFGESKCVCSAIWQKKTGASDAKGIAIVTEYILIYCNNSDNSTWNSIFTQNFDSYEEKRYRYQDEYVESRGKYYPDNLDRGGLSYSDSMNYGIECPDGTITYPNGRLNFENDGWIWKWGKDKVKWGIENGFIEFRESKEKASGWSVCYKNYMYVDNDGQSINRSAPYKNLIQGILNGEGTAEVKRIFGNPVFKNPKPIALIRSLIQSIAKNELMVLDFFAGSGTLGQAMQDINKNCDSKKIIFVLVQAPETLDIKSTTPETINAIKICKQLDLSLDIAQITVERLRRVMTGKCFDGSSNFKWIELNEPLGGSLDVYEIAGVSNAEHVVGKTPFDVIDETLYGKEKFSNLEDKIQWVCENFDNTQYMLKEKREEE